GQLKTRGEYGAPDWRANDRSQLAQRLQNSGNGGRACKSLTWPVANGIDHITSSTMKEKILIVTDDSGESFEILFAQQRFLEAGYQPVIAATKKKLLHGVIHDFE